MTTRFGKTYDNVGNRYKIFSKEEQESWPEGHKKCNRCKALRSFGEFGSDRRGLMGMTETCKPCRNTKAAANYAARPYERIIFDRAKSRATRKGLEFTITVDDIVIPRVCPALGIPLMRGQERMTDSSPSIDRIDSSRGYVPGNVRIISNRANRIKSDATLAELEAVARYIKEAQ